uniref:DUF7666 domain-containing protein n=1 Tax=Desulfobacca acetoxidans TaxID=60893 RepID=A0A7C3WHN9_9BACT
MKLYKVLAKGQMSCYGKEMVWEPGRWYEIAGDLVPCRNGFHLCREQDLLDWLHEEIWEADYEGEAMDHGNKLVVRKARITKQCAGWNERTARLFAVDCAEDVANMIPEPEAQHCLEVARAYAAGEASYEALASAREAAWEATREVAWDAAVAAASDAVYDAAQETAWAAARDAAWDSARAAARAAEDAGDAGAAALTVTKDAAYDATWVTAWAAAGDADGPAARAARDAAWKAARERQTRMLKVLVG